MHQQLKDMGYKEEDINRIINAGITDVADALDVLDPKSASSSSSRQPIPTSHTSSRGISGARDSLDRDDLHRAVPSLPGAPGQSADESDINLQRALLLSQKEQEERDTAEALKLSKEQTLAPPDQDPELMRAIEESLRDNQSCRKNDHNVSWQSHAFLDIDQRIRKDLDQPVGLRNIGNTCYLNSLLQVYYHLPEFRNAIMSFRPPVQFTPTAIMQPQTPPSQQQSFVEMPIDDAMSELSPEERLERKLAESQPDQSFAMQPNGGEFKNPPEGNSGMSYNYVENEDTSTPVQHAVQFVIELQKLFATMALGIQNCADPTGVMHAMRHHDGKPIVIGAQQDASEFNHLFLDIIEQGLKGTYSDDSHGNDGLSVPGGSDTRAMDNDTSKNVVKDLFTVQFRQELRSCDNVGIECSIEENVPDKINFGETNAIIVDATTNEYRDLHSGLDDFAYAYVDTAPTSSQTESPQEGSTKSVVAYKDGDRANNPALIDRTDSSDSGTSSKRMKSVWLTRMPPVIVIYLQRVRFNRNTAQAEKVHERYDFDTEISFDRYLESNKSASIRAREIVLRIRREKERLVQLLRTFRSFPAQRQSTKRHMEDAETTGTGVSGAPGRKQRLDGHCDPLKLYTQVGKSDSLQGMDVHHDTFFSAVRRVEARLREALNSSSDLFQVHGVSKEHLLTSMEVLQSIVENDAKKCESYKERLQSLVIEEKAAYNSLEESKYGLHAVLVHDGAPSGGHYWTFIRNWSASEDELKWMRLSDSNVSYVTEEEMLSWSIGGKSMASAYCLIYARKSSQENNFQNGRNIAAESRSLLPRARVDEVDEASADLTREFGVQNNGKDD